MSLIRVLAVAMLGVALLVAVAGVGFYAGEFIDPVVKSGDDGRGQCGGRSKRAQQIVVGLGDGQGSGHQRVVGGIGLDEFAVGIEHRIQVIGARGEGGADGRRQCPRGGHLPQSA